MPSSMTSGAAPSGKRDPHGSPRGECLEHDHAERLVPSDREQESTCSTQQLQLELVGTSPRYTGAVPRRAQRALRNTALPWLAHLRCEQESHPGLAGDLDRPVGPFVRRHPPEEQDVLSVVVSRAVAHDECRSVDPVMYDPCDLQVRSRLSLSIGDADDRYPCVPRPVQVRQFLVEWPMDRRDHPYPGIPLGIERPDDRVIVQRRRSRLWTVGMDTGASRVRPCRSASLRPREAPI